MKLTQYGTDNILIMIGFGILLILIPFFFDSKILSITLRIIGALFIGFTLWFFRDPERNTPREALNNDSIVIAPADGKVVEIKEKEENIFLKSKAIQISIFLSPLDVHVNRSPVNGTVKYFKYNPGDYFVAYHPKSSELNEQTHIGVENSAGKVFFKQITGILARRLVWDIKEGDNLVVGTRFGMMKFGSRMDVFVAAGSKILINEGDRVTAGITKIALLNK